MEVKGTLKYRKVQRTPQTGENAGKKLSLIHISNKAITRANMSHPCRIAAKTLGTAFLPLDFLLLPTICDFQCIIDGIVNLVFGTLRIAQFASVSIALVRSVGQSLPEMCIRDRCITVLRNCCAHHALSLIHI